jgi:hypothetical protein
MSFEDKRPRLENGTCNQLKYVWSFLDNEA